jgi:PAS domain S-box-containing protein
MASPREDERDSPVPGKTYPSILIVEDDAEIRQSLAEILREEGFKIAVASNGAEALRWLNTGLRPSVVLLDLMMPVMDGWEFRRRQLANPAYSSIPVVLLTGVEATVQAVEQLKALGSVTKPFTIEPLLRLLGEPTHSQRRRGEQSANERGAGGDAGEREAERVRWQLLLDNVYDYAIFMIDPAGHVLGWNKGAERVYGYSDAETIGQSIARFHTPGDREAGKPEREIEVAIREGRFEEETWRVRKDGSRFWASIVISPMRSEDGRLLGLAKVTRDLTEHRKLELERMRVAQAEEAVRLRDEFLSIASHELRTPLTALSLQVHALLERADTLDAKVASKVRRIERSSSRLSDLIETLLDVSRIATGRFPMTPTSCDLVGIAEEVVERFAELAASAHAELTLEKQVRHVVGSWDRLRIEQVVMNVVDNAIKYGGANPVRMVVGVDDGTAVVSVIDKGPGIAEGDRERIFGRFERATSIRNYGGFGLGLYVAREIVAAHHGTIVAENEPSGGARFTIRLPMRSQAAGPHANDGEVLQ